MTAIGVNGSCRSINRHAGDQLPKARATLLYRFVGKLRHQHAVVLAFLYISNMSDSASTGPPPQTTAHVQQPSPQHYYPPHARQPSGDLGPPPPWVSTPDGSSRQHSGQLPPQQPPVSTPWEVLPGGHEESYPSPGVSASSAYPHVYPPHPHAHPQAPQIPPPWYPPPGPQLRPGQIIVDRKQYESDLKEIDELRDMIRQLKLNLHREQDEHADKLHELKRKLQLEHRDIMEAQQQQVLDLEKIVDDLKQKVFDATHNMPTVAEVPQQAKAQVPASIPDMHWGSSAPAQPAPQPAPQPTTPPTPQVSYPTVPTDDIMICPMQCGFAGCRDLLQVHMFEFHPELFDEGPSMGNPSENQNEGRTNEPTGAAVKNRKITVVLQPGNVRQEFTIPENAPLREFNEKIKQVTGREMSGVNLFAGGKALDVGASLNDGWLSVVPPSFKECESMIMLCQFKR